MTEVGTVIDGKYEILKEIGRGGMSYVYLANDTHLNRNWAVKEVKKKGSGKNDEIVVNSLLAEANMVKKLDHPALPRIVDIIDDGNTIYIIMDFIEGESLDKILKAEGPQPEDTVINWAMQICDVFSYLHSQKPPIIYRDMKPANLMLKPNGNISIIDFGIAREYKEQNLADTTVLGTKGYAPPEQYSGQTDARSDIFALGMTMHHLLTGVDPRSGEAYVPVRQWNPELSDGIEFIINKCVEPVPENRYQNCTELLVDLQEPGKVTRNWRNKLRTKLLSFIIPLVLSILLAVTGVILGIASSNVNNQDYDAFVNSSDADKYYSAVEIFPERTAAYDKLVEYYKNNGATNEQIAKLGNTLENNSSSLDVSDPETARLYYDVGKLFFSEYDGNTKERSVNAKSFFQTASESPASFEKKEIAQCYYSICTFMTNQSNTSEHSLDDYNALFDEINAAIKTVENLTDSESNYDKMTLYYSTMCLIHSQAEYMAGVGFEESRTNEMMESLHNKVNAITSTLSYVNNLKDEINDNYNSYMSNIHSKYNEVNKRRAGEL
jgi:serine/threonine-protein kinase